MTAGAHFQINQASNTVPTGTVDVARIDMRYGAALHLVGDSSSGQVSPAWTILAWPNGSARSQPTNRTTFDATYTADVPGSYLCEFLVNDGTAGNRKQFVFAATQDANGLIVDDAVREPAYGEQTGDDNAGSNDRGYAKAFEVGMSGQVPAIATVAALRNRRAAKHKHVHLTADGVGGMFRWDAASVVADDGGVTFQPGFGTGAAMATGRWVRVFVGAVYVTWFGADFTGAVDCATAFTAAANAGRHVVIPPGTYKLTAGWSVPRANITIELADGATLRCGNTIITDVENINWQGHAYGFNPSVTARPNMVWTGGAGIGMEFSRAGNSNGSRLDGIQWDGGDGAGGIVAGFTAYAIGVPGFGASGFEWWHFGGIDCETGWDDRTNAQQNWFHQPCFGFRTGTVHALCARGMSVGATTNTGSITSTTIGDWGGSVSGYVCGIEIGSESFTGQPSTIQIGGGRLVLEHRCGADSHAVKINVGFDVEVTGVHAEITGAAILTISGGTPNVVTTDEIHNLTNATTVKIFGNTGVNGEYVITTTGPKTLTLNGTAGGPGGVGGSIADVTDAHSSSIVKVGTGSKVPENVSIHGNLMAGPMIQAVKLVNSDSMAVYDNDIDVSGGGTAAHPAYALKYVAGAGRCLGNTWGFQRKVARPTFYGGDVSNGSDSSRWDFVFSQNRGASNESRAELRTGGRIIPDVYHYGANGTNIPGFGGIQLGETYTIVSASNTTPIVLELSTNHRMRDGDQLHVKNNAAANGDWPVLYVDRTHVSLTGSTAGGVVAGGSCTVVGSFVAQYVTQFDLTFSTGGALVQRVTDNCNSIVTARDLPAAVNQKSRSGLQYDQFFWNPDAGPAAPQNAPLTFGVTFDDMHTTSISPNGPYMHGDWFMGLFQMTWRYDSHGPSIQIGQGTQGRIYTGSGVPNFSAPYGSIWLRQDGNAGTTFYVNEGAGGGGAGNNWVAK